MSSEQSDFRKLNILHETETVGKQFLMILMNSWKTNLVKSGFESCFQSFLKYFVIRMQRLGE